MLETLNDIDVKLFLFLNKFHAPLWDEIMGFTTSKYTWMPLYVLLLIYLIWKYKKYSVLFIVTFILAIVCADQLSSGLFKPLTERLRPCYNPDIAHLVHTINNHCGGRFGYFSGHAANTFAGASLFWFLYRNKSPYVSIVFIWALAVAYSRIYVGVHYPGDVLTGIVAGILIGWMMYKLLQLTVKKIGQQGLID